MNARARRQIPRGMVRGAAQIAGLFGKCSGELTQLSVGGAFVAGVPALRVGMKVRVLLFLPHDRLPIEARARVLYTRPAQGFSEAGVGLAFEALQGVDRGRIASAIERADFLYMQLLFRLRMTDATRKEIDEACVEAGLPAGLSFDELSTRIAEALSEFGRDP